MFAQSTLLAEISRLEKFALRLTRNKCDADDLVQATCLRALEKSDYFSEGSNMFSWTSKIMFNLFATTYRRKSKFETRFDPSVHLEMQSVAPRQDVDSELINVSRAMSKLKAMHREILMLVCAQELQYEEVSVLLNIPVGTVRSRLSRARAQLKTILETPRVMPVVRHVSNQNTPRMPAYIAAWAMAKQG